MSLVAFASLHAGRIVARAGAPTAGVLFPVVDPDLVDLRPKPQISCPTDERPSTYAKNGSGCRYIPTRLPVGGEDLRLGGVGFQADEPPQLLAMKTFVVGHLALQLGSTGGQRLQEGRARTVPEVLHFHLHDPPPSAPIMPPAACGTHLQSLDAARGALLRQRPRRALARCSRWHRRSARVHVRSCQLRDRRPCLRR